MTPLLLKVCIILHAGEDMSASFRETSDSMEVLAVLDESEIMQWLRQAPDAVNYEPAATLETVSVQAPRQLTGVQLQVQQRGCISQPFFRQADESFQVIWMTGCTACVGQHQCQCTCCNPWSSLLHRGQQIAVLCISARAQFQHIPPMLELVLLQPAC